MSDGQPTGSAERGETYTVAPHPSCPHCEGTLERGGGRYSCDSCGRRWGAIYIEHIDGGQANDTGLDDGESTRENRSSASKTSSNAETTSGGSASTSEQPLVEISCDDVLEIVDEVEDTVLAEGKLGASRDQVAEGTCARIRRCILSIQTDAGQEVDADE